MEKDYLIIDNKKYEIVMTFQKENNDEYEYVVYKNDGDLCGGKYKVNEENKTLITDLDDEEKDFVNKVYERSIQE